MLGTISMSKKIVNHTDLDAYQQAFDMAMQIFELSKSFPKEETYSLTDQIRRSSRSVCANMGEAWRKRRYERHLSANYPIRKAKPLKRKYGSPLQSNADTCRVKK